MTRTAPVTVVGIGDDGCVGLTSRAANAIVRAQVLVGGERHLAFFPDFAGERIVLKGGLSQALKRTAELAEDHNVCVLASGDPLFFGIGGLVAKTLGAASVEIIPAPSSVQLAFSRLGLKWEDAEVISVHGRRLHGLATKLRRHRKVVVLTDEENSPARIATHLIEYGQSGWQAWVCENLGGTDERVREFSLDALAAADNIASLNVLVLVRTVSDWQAPATAPYFDDEAFARRMPKKGLITKKEVRLLSLARMGLRPDSVVWDIGAGSGSVSIEAALTTYDGRVYAVEVDDEGVEICRENVRRFGTDNVTVVPGRAPEALEGLEVPDAVFIGGSKGAMDSIIGACLERLAPGGRLVANAITLENVAEAYRAFRDRDLVPEVTLLQVSRAVPLARYLRYEALNPIQVFSVRKPSQES